MKERKTTKLPMKAHASNAQNEINYLTCSNVSNFDYESVMLQEGPMRPVKVDIFMRLYIGDYLKDTMHLSTFEHGVYILLIIAYWTNRGPLPDDDAQLANIARVTREQWLDVRPTIGRFFQIRDGKWHHKRIEAELLIAKADLETKHERGKKGAEARWAKERAKNAAGNASATPEQSQSESQSQSQSDSVSETKTESKTVTKCVINALDEALEEEWLRRTRDLLGDKEMEGKKGGFWRTLMRDHPSAYRDALVDAESRKKEAALGLPEAQITKTWAHYLTYQFKEMKKAYARKQGKS